MRPDAIGIQRNWYSAQLCAMGETPLSANPADDGRRHEGAEGLNIQRIRGVVAPQTGRRLDGIQRAAVEKKVGDTRRTVEGSRC